jgi:hypothetical protein
MSVVDTVKNALPSLPSVSFPTLPNLPISAELQADAKKLPYAAVGAGDLAVARVRAEVPTIPATVQAQVSKAQTFAATLPAKAQSQAKLQVALAKALPALVEAKVSKPLQARRLRAHGIFSELTSRGEKVVAGIRKQPATLVAEKSVAQTVRSAKATTTSAKKATKATAKAVSKAADSIG